MKLREHLASRELQSLRSLELWCEGKQQMTAGQVKEAVQDVVNVLGWVLDSETTGKRP